MSVCEVVVKGNRSCALEIAYKVTEWSTQNRVHLNSEKCKELRISFVKDEPRFAPIVVDENELERVSSAKLLGLTITSNLTLNEHISEKSVKASVFFSAEFISIQEFLARDMSTFYTACIRSVITYAAPVFF